MTERLYPIPGRQFRDYYITRSGVVWSYKRSTPHRISVRRANYNGTLYETVSLRGSAISQTNFIHRLLGLTFLPNPQRLPVVAHKNLKTLDNRISNLYWTRMRDLGKKIMKKVFFSQKRRFTDREVRKIRAKYKAGIGPVELSKEYKTHRSHLLEIATKRAYKWVK